MTTTNRPAKTSSDICRRLVGLLTERTGVTFTFGYLGDVSGIPGTPAYQDSRSYYAFAAHPGRVGTHQDSIGGVSDPADLIPMLRGALALVAVLATPRSAEYAQNR